MNHYFTYFDRGYLPQGLALWRSLARHGAAAVLWVLALDDDTVAMLRDLGDTRLKVLTLAELLVNDPQLSVVQMGRPRQEFIFTLTPCLTRYLLKLSTEGAALVYLDADLLFFADPAPIWRTMEGNSVLVVAHHYPAWHDDSALYGRFNVGVLGFRNDTNGRACVDWWRDRCLESCALTTDATHYGDQKYLDEWPQRFPGVVELTHPGVNVAPWNWAGRRFEIRDGLVFVEGEPLVVFHFAQFRRVSVRWFDSGQLEYGIMPRWIRSRIYGEYWNALLAAEAEIRRRKPEFSIPRRGWKNSLGSWHIAALRLFWGQFWFRAGKTWWSGRLGVGRWSGHAMGRYRKIRRSSP